MKDLTIPHEVADGIVLAVMRDQLGYLLREQRWFECPDADRFALEGEYGYRMWCILMTMQRIGMN